MQASEACDPGSNPGGAIKMENCGLCKVFKEGSQIINESELSFSMINFEPLKEGHIMILPKRHIESLPDFSEKESKDFFKLLNKMYPLIEKNYGGILMLLNGEKFKTQKHIHMHIIPVKSGLRQIISNFESIPARKRISEEEMKELRNKIKGLLQEI